jgi:hypothetical protein
MIDLNIKISAVISSKIRQLEWSITKVRNGRDWD